MGQVDINSAGAHRMLFSFCSGMLRTQTPLSLLVSNSLKASIHGNACHFTVFSLILSLLKVGTVQSEFVWSHNGFCFSAVGSAGSFSF